jgi:signal transduction histidine kinase
VHGLVAQLEGRITVASEPGKGSAFLVTIPLRRENGQEVDEPVIMTSEGLGVP